MVKILFGFIIALSPLLSKAQVTVSVQLPPAGMIQKDQLWNVVLVNNSNEIPEIFVSLNLQDAVTGQTVLSAGSRSMILGKGIKMLNSSDVQPIQYNYLAAEFNSNFIPLGSYVACYRVLKNLGEGTVPLADECVRLNISPLSPPLLATPGDKSLVQTPYPQFSWLPPSPAEMFNSLNYDIVVTEVLQGQSPTEAMFNNAPVYSNGNIRMPFESYPPSSSSLQTGKQYAWQVTARNGLNYSAQTEVWTFSLRSGDSSQVISPGTTYISLKNDGNEGIHFITDNNLFVKYYSYFKEHEANLRILTSDGKIVQEIKHKIIYGDNFLSLRLRKSIQENKVYTLEISDPKQIKHVIQFSIKK